MYHQDFKYFINLQKNRLKDSERECIIYKNSTYALSAGDSLCLFFVIGKGLGMKFISPKMDFCMKQLFQNEVVRKYFLSDVLDIPVKDNRSTRIQNTFLWKRYRNQKLGILDVLMEMNDNTKINVELQVKRIKYWEKRQLFYLAKIYVSDLLMGEEYHKLKRCIDISILDFELDMNTDEYHRVYKLRDEEGNVFSEDWEIHVLELGKRLKGMEAVDDWIRLFDAESVEDLDMLKTNNKGILEAIRQLKIMSLGKIVMANYEEYLKGKRDMNAYRDYVMDEGIEEGEKKALIVQVCKKLRKNKPIEIIAEELEEDIEKIQSICNIAVKYAPDYDVDAILKEWKK